MWRRRVSAAASATASGWYADHPVTAVDQPSHAGGDGINPKP